jgi:hypothetical protein
MKMMNVEENSSLYYFHAGLLITIKEYKLQLSNMTSGTVVLDLSYRTFNRNFCTYASVISTKQIFIKTGPPFLEAEQVLVACTAVLWVLPSQAVDHLP